MDFTCFSNPGLSDSEATLQAAGSCVGGRAWPVLMHVGPLLASPQVLAPGALRESGTDCPGLPAPEALASVLICLQSP